MIKDTTTSRSEARTHALGNHGKVHSEDATDHILACRPNGHDSVVSISESSLNNVLIPFTDVSPSLDVMVVHRCLSSTWGRLRNLWIWPAMCVSSSRSTGCNGRPWFFRRGCVHSRKRAGYVADGLGCHIYFSVVEVLLIVCQFYITVSTEKKSKTK